MNICIVEDELDNMRLLEEFLLKFGQENNMTFNIGKFRDGLTFLDAYRPECDLVLLDIQMPGIDGMETARRLRKIDGQVNIIFVTNLIKYAIHGYEVHAYDYIVKPLNYYDFSARLKKLVAHMSGDNRRKIVLFSKGVMKRVSIDEVYYVEVCGHNLCWHTADGDVTLYGALTKAEKELPQDSFAKCNSGNLINLMHVQSLEKDMVQVAGKWIPISRPKKKEFITVLTNYLAR